MIITRTDIEQQCQICWSMILIGDERAMVHHDDGDRLACVMCAAAAERLGWCISV